MIGALTGGEIVRSFYAAVERGELETALASLAPDCAWTEMDGLVMGGTYRGPAQIRDDVFARIGSEWEQLALSVEEVLDAGDLVVGVGTYTGTNRATGRSFEARVAHVFRIRDGVIAAFEQFTDSAKIAAARTAGPR